MSVPGLSTGPSSTNTRPARISDWAWLRLGRSVLWTVSGVATPILFAVLLTRIDSGFAGRAYAV